MSIFDNLGKKIGETAQAAQKKANETIEITKLNKSIANEEDKIEKIYRELGKKVYELYSQGQDVGEHFEQECEEISVYEDNIKDIRKKIMQLKNIRLCPSCGTEIDEDISFCSKCGTKIEAPVPEMPPEEEKQPDYKVCPVCGSKLTMEAAFCPSCGTRQEVADNHKVEAEETKHCPQCGEEVQAGVIFCKTCGTKVN